MNTKFGVDFRWRYLVCPAPGGGRPVDKFVAELGPEAENDLAAILEDLQVLERKFWRRPQFDILHGNNYHGLGEVIFNGDNKTYRLFGWFGPQRLCFTLLVGCIKKRDLKHEMDEAAKRRDFAEANPKLLYAFTFDISPSSKTGK